MYVMIRNTIMKKATAQIRGGANILSQGCMFTSYAKIKKSLAKCGFILLYL